MVFPLVRSDSWSAFLTVDPDLFCFRSYTQQQVEFSKMGLNQRRLCSLCWEKFWGGKFQWWRKRKTYLLVSSQGSNFCSSVWEYSLCASLHWSMHCGFNFSFIILGIHFPGIIKGVLGSWVSYKCQFIFSFYFIDTAFHMRLLTEVFYYHWRQ